MWLSLASGRPCHNLDFFLMQNEEILATFAAHARETDIALIEGNKGLYDGSIWMAAQQCPASPNCLATP